MRFLKQFSGGYFSEVGWFFAHILAGDCVLWDIPKSAKSEEAFLARHCTRNARCQRLCRHPLHISRFENTVVTLTVFVLKGSFKDDGHDFHIFMRMGPKAFTGLDDVVVKDAQGPKIEAFYIVIASKTKAVLAIEPLILGDPPLRGHNHIYMHDITHSIT